MATFADVHAYDEILEDEPAEPRRSTRSQTQKDKLAHDDFYEVVEELKCVLENIEKQSREPHPASIIRHLRQETASTEERLKWAYERLRKSCNDLPTESRRENDQLQEKIEIVRNMLVRDDEPIGISFSKAKSDVPRTKSLPAEAARSESARSVVSRVSSVKTAISSLREDALDEGIKSLEHKLNQMRIEREIARLEKYVQLEADSESLASRPDVESIGTQTETPKSDAVRVMPRRESEPRRTPSENPKPSVSSSAQTSSEDLVAAISSSNAAKPQTETPKSDAVRVMPRRESEPRITPSENPKPSVSSSAQISSEDLVAAISSSIAANRLPVPEPFKFEGDPLRFPAWKAAFSLLIEGQGVEAKERIYHLQRYLGDGPRAAVESLFYFNTENAYSRAMAILEKRYGNAFFIAEGFRDKIDNWPKVGDDDYAALLQFADFLQQALFATSEIPSLDILNDCRENKKMLEKLPNWLTRKWKKTVANHTDLCKYPTFENFVNFLERESNIVNNPVFAPARSAPSQQPRKAHTHHTTSEAKSREVCTYCEKEHHQINNCRKFGATAPAERRDFIMRKGICFGCLKLGHVAKNCPKKDTCAKCSKKHPTPLCPDSRQGE
jgi:hypothetical protein